MKLVIILFTWHTVANRLVGRSVYRWDFVTISGSVDGRQVVQVLLVHLSRDLSTRTHFRESHFSAP